MSATSAPSQKCAILAVSEQHRYTAIALTQLCEAQGWVVRITTADADEFCKALATLNKEGLAPGLVLHASGSLLEKSAMDTTAKDFQQAWQSGCLSGALIGQQAIEVMLEHGNGTLIFLGQLEGTEPRLGNSCMSVASAGLRSFAQSMAREFGPKGLHIAHVLLSAHPSPEPSLVAANCLQLHKQHRSTWTHELDLRATRAATAV